MVTTSASSNPASYADVEARWRSLDTQEQTNAVTFLNDAWRDVRRRVPGIAERIELEDAELGEGEHGDLHDETVRVLVTAVLRVLKNPDGTQREGLDNASWEPNQAAASGLLVIQDRELAALQPEPAGHLGGAYVIGLGG